MPCSVLTAAPYFSALPPACFFLSGSCGSEAAVRRARGGVVVHWQLVLHLCAGGSTLQATLPRSAHPPRSVHSSRNGSLRGRKITVFFFSG